MSFNDPLHDDVKPVRTGLGARLRAYFFTGIVIVGPVAATAYIAWWFIDTVDHWVTPIVPRALLPDTYLPWHVPGIGVIIALVGLTLLGFLTANIAGRTLVRLGERILSRMPVVRGLYKSLKQVFETIFSQSGTSFRKVGLVQYPMPGWWTLVFISSKPGPLVSGYLPEGEDFTSIFLPCTPNPTTGFYIYLPTKDVIEVPMSPDTAAKLIMSAGLIQPEGQAMLAGLAQNARKPSNVPA
ncbi:DUF502 domain-containing protein [Methylovirgula sp. 4M-Z18]|uniref:DUF502 domain-containing protein n=1 Tax=Methylovirgula sp. 4M-Z18 TaxID=2293567 RepID=UPI000E2ECC54|nr:DUF502 domain-containing protein [Methylovirgula sp. 4M-Z18]RFB80609.1 DUF502 domain-containing protein [Methylovirgula sp. 4M-Z18]